MIDDFETRFQTETSDLATLIAETQSKIETLVQTAEESLARPAVTGKEQEPRDMEGSQTLAIRILGERSNGRNGTQPLFFGQVELRADNIPFDYRYLKSLKKHFSSIPSIKYLQESASEKDVSVLIDITEPLPLLEVLSTSPLVDEVISESDRQLSVIFKPLSR
jgi:hypothetical protein